MKSIAQKMFSLADSCVMSANGASATRCISRPASACELDARAHEVRGVKMDFTAIGDTVNTAARLCAAAGPGEVLVTEAVRGELGNASELGLEALEPMRLKGKTEAVAVYRVTQPGRQH